MFKLIATFALLFIVQAQIPGGFTDRPDLLRNPLTDSFVKLALTDLASRQNLRAVPVNVVSVATQVVNGINYRIVFNARSVSTNALLTCTTKIYQSFSGTQSVSSVDCA